MTLAYASGGEWIYSAMTDTQRVLFWAVVLLGYFVVNCLTDRGVARVMGVGRRRA